MVMITLYEIQQKRHRCIEQSVGLCGRGRGWDDLGEWHWNMYNVYETNRQSRFDAWYWMFGTGALGRPRGMVQGGRGEGDSGWGTCVHPWWIHVDVWQNQYNIVKLKKKTMVIIAYNIALYIWKLLNFKSSHKEIVTVCSDRCLLNCGDHFAVHTANHWCTWKLYNVKCQLYHNKNIKYL